MTDPLLDYEQQNIDPIELQNTLIGFLGQTYSEVSKFDSNLVSPNPFLAPKKQEFEKIAERVIQEVSLPKKQSVVHPVNNNIQRTQQPTAFIDTGVILPPAPNDPNQMEFNFNNSVTAKTINSKLEDLEKRIKKLDSNIEKMLLLLESHDSKNS